MIRSLLLVVLTTLVLAACKNRYADSPVRDLPAKEKAQISDHPAEPAGH